MRWNISRYARARGRSADIQRAVEPADGFQHTAPEGHIGAHAYRMRCNQLALLSEER